MSVGARWGYRRYRAMGFLIYKAVTAKTGADFAASCRVCQQASNFQVLNVLDATGGLQRRRRRHRVRRRLMGCWRPGTRRGQYSTTCVRGRRAGWRRRRNTFPRQQRWKASSSGRRHAGARSLKTIPWGWRSQAGVK